MARPTKDVPPRTLPGRRGRRGAGTARRYPQGVLDRYPPGTTHELRSILARQAMAAHETSFPAIGRY